MPDPMTIGILAIQGDYAEHRRTLERIGAGSRLVRHAHELSGLDGLILPGGESTTMLKFFIEQSLMKPIQDFYQAGGSLYGTCAGAILLAKEVTAPAQPSLGLLDIGIERNAYGRQVDSHVAHEPCPLFGEPPLEMVFIRAPVIRSVGAGIEVLAEHQGHPVFVRQDRILATTFHPELSPDDRVHRFFVELAKRGAGVTAPGH